jgi:pimeloyl-ACP methyl ester carboxylesterase
MAAYHLRAPAPTRDDGAPPLPYLLTEGARAMVELGLFLGTGPMRLALPHGDGHPVLVLPGLGGSDVSTRALRGTLRRLDYQVHGWRLGRNIGPTERAVSGMRGLLDELTEEHGKAVSLVGWSLGGIFARELARQAPDRVRQVVTLGSPFRLARAGQSRAAWLYDRYSHLHVAPYTLPLEKGTRPLRVPTTSVYSRCDGIVAWQACLNPAARRAENIAVYGSHLGLGHNPAVVWAVADRLAQPEGRWRPFQPPLLLRHLFPEPDQAPASRTSRRRDAVA